MYFEADLPEDMLQVTDKWRRYRVVVPHIDEDIEAPMHADDLQKLFRSKV